MAAYNHQDLNNTNMMMMDCGYMCMCMAGMVNLRTRLSSDSRFI